MLGEPSTRYLAVSPARLFGRERTGTVILNLQVYVQFPEPK
jgi:hypothetical protein